MMMMDLTYLAKENERKREFLPAEKNYKIVKPLKDT